jgi:hypothetical protein
MLDGAEFALFDIEDSDAAALNSSDACDGVIDGWEPLQVDPIDFDIQDVDTTKENRSSVADGGSIRDIEALERTLRIAKWAGTERIQWFIVRCITGLFAIWTIAALVSYLMTGNSWLLLSDAGPAALFGIVVHYYFKKE